MTEKGNIKNGHMANLHSIVRKNAYSQALFMWVDGALTIDPNMSLRRAIRLFSERFDLPNLDIRSAATQYNRLRHDYLKQNQVFTQ